MMQVHVCIVDVFILYKIRLTDRGILGRAINMSIFIERYPRELLIKARVCVSIFSNIRTGCMMQVHVCIDSNIRTGCYR